MRERVRHEAARREHRQRSGSRRWVLALAFAALAACRPAAAAQTAAPDTLRAGPSCRLHQTLFLYRLSTPFLPPDGLLRVGLTGRLYGIPAELGAGTSVDVQEYALDLEYGLLPGLFVAGSLPYRSWRGDVGTRSLSGAGLGDARLVGSLGLPSPASWLGWALRAGTSLATGDAQAGLGEGHPSPEVALSAGLRLWRRSQLPQMRLIFNLGYRWNRQEAGQGLVTERPAPWPPLYPAVPPGGKAQANDFLFWGTALEFRQATASLFLEYSEARLPWSDAAARRENQRFLTAGLTWGRSGGPAIRLSYDVSLALDDPATDFVPAYPDLVSGLTFSYQVPLGGRDRDDDSIPDRDDLCPDAPEDRDGYADQDGCPDLDNDGDGVPDYLDGAPLAPEDHDGFADEDGIPDPDNDGDGIPDLRDSCPNEAEDFDGYQDGDGCPEEFLDRDADGIDDAEDRCPDLPEDLDGFEDRDGCPDTDNDLDGIPDVRDSCPDQPENYNGIEDDDGCPDGSP